MFNERAHAMYSTDTATAASTSHISAHPPLPRQDTRAWRLQVWASFATAVVLCATGLAWLPGHDLDRAFMVMGYLFCMSAAFLVAKTVRDNEARPVDAPLWSAVVWGSLASALLLTAWGLWRMDINPNYKAYMAVSWLFLVSCVFTLAKTLRDAHETKTALQAFEAWQRAQRG
jgi:hypothetical protein